MPRRKKPLLDGFYTSLFEEGITFCFCPDEYDDGTVDSLLSGDEETGLLYSVVKGSESKYVYEADEYDEGVLLYLYEDIKGTLTIVDKYLYYRDCLLKWSSLGLYIDEDETVPLGADHFNYIFGDPDEGWILKDDGSFIHYKSRDDGEDVSEGCYKRVRDDFLVTTDERGVKSIFFIYNRNLVDQSVLVKPNIKYFLSGIK